MTAIKNRFINTSFQYNAMLITNTRASNDRFGFNKAVNELSKVIETNAIIPFLMERKGRVLSVMQYRGDRAIIVVALNNSAFPFSYEDVCILGKYLHVQYQVSRKLLEGKISEIYGFNKSISNAIDTAYRH